MLFLNLLTLLVFTHFLCDFSLQNDYVAKAKDSNSPLGSNGIWVIVLSAHSAIHALPVFLTGIYLFGLDRPAGFTMGLFMFLTHFFIDRIKTCGKISYYQDQVLHIVVVFIIAATYTLAYS